jgi:hypothetical protein
MSNNFIELLKVLINSNNPEQAVKLAANIIFDFPQPNEQHQEETFACLQEEIQTRSPC